MAYGLLNNTSYTYSGLTAAGTTTFKSSPGILHAITVGTLGTSTVVTVYDNTTASGNPIATITPTVVGTFLFDATFVTGLTVVVAGTGTPSVTVLYQ